MSLEHHGQVLLGGRLWGVDRMALPGPKIELLVAHSGKTLGRFVLTPTPGFEEPLQPRVVAVALPDQAGASLASRLRSASRFGRAPVPPVDSRGGEENHDETDVCRDDRSP